MRKKLIKPIDDLKAIRKAMTGDEDSTGDLLKESVDRFNACALPLPFAALRKAESEYDRKASESLAEEARATITAQDPISAMLDGIRFHNKIDRHELYSRISRYVSREVAVARITADVSADKRVEELNKTIRSLTRELQRAHNRHVDDLVEAHGANLAYEATALEKGCVR